MQLPIYSPSVLTSSVSHVLDNIQSVNPGVERKTWSTSPVCMRQKAKIALKLSGVEEKIYMRMVDPRATLVLLCFTFSNIPNFHAEGVSTIKITENEVLYLGQQYCEELPYHHHGMLQSIHTCKFFQQDFAVLR